ncbi:hypothetical protein [Luteibacter sp.]|uniref:hypothetical protein n=1 Tax=Luteibacter sp. TaxID=1886636 RepID=UPI003F8199AC
MERSEVEKPRKTFAIRVVQATGLLVAIYVLAVIAISHAQRRALDETRVGVSEQSARSSFWFTPGVEIAASSDAGAGGAFTTPDSRCKSPCVRRLWWIHPLLPDMEAWTVDLDSDGKVVKTYHWSSP